MTPSVTWVAQGSGEVPLIMLHGIGGGAELFRAQLDLLSRSRRTVAWNMPGYGDAPPADPLTFPALSAALETVLDRLAAPRADLFGHSIGGMIALDFAARHPARVRSLILCATAPAFGSRDGTFQERFLADRLGPLDAGRTMAEIAEEAIRGLIGEGADPDGVTQARKVMARVPAQSYRSAVHCLTTFDRRDALERIVAPTLLIGGERDHAAPARTMKRMSEKMPNARYIEIAGAGHLLPNERPREINRLVAEFLTALEEKAA